MTHSMQRNAKKTLILQKMWSQNRYNLGTYAIKNADFLCDLR